MPAGIIRLDEGWHFDEGHRLDEPPHVPPVILPPVPVKRKKSTMPKSSTSDFVPRQRNDRRPWLQGISDNIVAEAVKFGGAPADATAAKGFADLLLGKMDATDAASTALDGARNVERTTQTSVMAQLRAFFRNWKTLAGWAGSGSEAVLKAKGTSTDLDTSAYKPVLTVTIETGFVRLDFDKLGVDAMAIYSRLHSTDPFVRLAIDTEAPYLDTRPLAQAGVPEVREYMGRGMLGDEEIGLDSDIVRIAFGG